MVLTNLNPSDYENRFHPDARSELFNECKCSLYHAPFTFRTEYICRGEEEKNQFLISITGCFENLILPGSSLVCVPFITNSIFIGNELVTECHPIDNFICHEKILLG